VDKKRSKGKNLRIGVTGGIATGKTTVAGMLSDLGALLIDFDSLARIAQQPGKPAFRDIVDFFGEQILTRDGELDRKQLAAIVFRDVEKRRRLEHFTHPRIFEEYERQFERYSNQNPDAIIQVVIPLLIENNLQSMFDKIVLVFISKTEQIKRLMIRDGISKRSAERILAAQLPIDEKRQYADFIIDNTQTLEQTRRQVEALWERLSNLRR
jgi:dephospho-CoA kinase